MSVGLDTGKTGLGLLKGASAGIVLGVASAAGYYAGIVEYMADTAFIW